MAITIIGPAAASLPLAQNFWYVEIKQSWSDDWQYTSELEAITAERHTASVGLSRAHFRRRYGSTMIPGETSFTQRIPLNLRNYWIRISLFGNQGTDVIWQGRIMKEVRAIMGSGGNQRTGNQEWIAYGGETILAGLDFYESYWYGTGGAADRLGWLPSFNRKSARGEVLGNRSIITGSDGTHLFGDPIIDSLSKWTHRQIIDYLIQHYINQSGGPTWTLGGELDYLDTLLTFVPMPQTTNILALLRTLIPTRYALDFEIEPSANGFLIWVFSTVANDYSIGSHTLPRNPNITRIDASTAIDLTCTLEVSNSEAYDKIRLIGERIKVQGTLTFAASQLVKGWTAQQETDYETVPDNANLSAELQDRIRADDRFRDVFCTYRAKDAFDWASLGIPNLNLDTSFINLLPQTQSSLRQTLRHLLTREGWDYTTATPVDNNPANSDADLTPPFVLVKDEFTGHLIHVDRMSAVAGAGLPSASIAVLENDWGVRLRIEPNHTFARNQMTLSGNVKSQYDPSAAVDYTTARVTIAVESDHRIDFGADVPDNLAGGDDKTKVIYIPGVEFWYLCPNTVMGVTDGKPGDPVQLPIGTELYSHQDGITLRDDSDELARQMPGAIARYIADRVKATVEIRNLQPWANLLGTILEAVEDAGDQQGVNAPITSIRWNFDTSRSTTISTGQALK